MLTRRDFLVHTSRCSVALAANSLLPLQAGTGALGGSLREHAATHGLRYGAAVDIGLLRTDAAYRKLLAEQCGIVVAENAMKWQAVHPSADTYTFDQADELVAFAEQHRMEVRGHNLCWHEALPGWFESFVTPGNAAQVLTSHIRMVAGRYKGRMRAWDVVNEAVWIKDGRPDGLRNSVWLKLLGPGYLKLAFHTARQADPHALLTYNEYGIEYDRPESIQKRTAVLGLLRRMVAEGTPIDAVGIQSHLDATTTALGPGVVQFGKDVQALGLKVFLTELDVNDDNLVETAGDDAPIRDAAVAKVYAEYVSAMVTNGGVADILTWGVSDNHCWLNSSKAHIEKHPTRQQRALPFDATYQPTAAFYALRAAFDRQKA